jgi:hypothetical protein
MRSRIAVAVGLIVLCAGCGHKATDPSVKPLSDVSAASSVDSSTAPSATPDPTRSTAASPTSTSASPGVPPTTTAAPVPKPERPTHRPSPSHAKPAPRSIELAGPSVDNSYPAEWGVFPDPGTQCSAMYLLAGDLDVPLQVDSMAADGPFRVVAPPAGCSQDDGVDHPSCRGHVFDAGPVTEGSRCFIAVQLPSSVDGHDYTGRTLTVHLSATCKAATGFVCGRAAASHPTPANPVTVGLVQATHLRACLASVPDGSASGPDGGELYLEVDENCRVP